MVFEMPEEISGQRNRNVVCQGRVMRSRERDRADHERDKAETDENDNFLAASIVDYKFIH
jgi:hypothetical protein